MRTVKAHSVTGLEELGVERELLEKGSERCVVRLGVPANLLYFSGHFPGDPVLPGVVQLDAMVLAQVERVWPDLGRLERVRRLKFIRAVKPGEQVRLRLDRSGAKISVAVLLGDDSTCTSGIFYFTVR